MVPRERWPAAASGAIYISVGLVRRGRAMLRPRPASRERRVAVQGVQRVRQRHCADEDRREGYADGHCLTGCCC